MPLNLLRQETATLEIGEQETAVCDYKVYRGVGKAKGKIVVVASDRGGGAVAAVVANQVEAIAGRVCREEGIAPDKLIFIEHHPARHDFEETYDLVHLEFRPREQTFAKPEWSSFTKEATAALTGEKIR